MFLEIMITIMAVAILLLVLFAIPSLLQVRRTAEAVAVTMQALNESLPGILKNLESITANIHQATVAVNRRVEELSDSLRQLQNTLAFLADLGRIARTSLRIPFLNSLTSLAAFVKGVSVFLSVLSEKSDLPGSFPNK